MSFRDLTKEEIKEAKAIYGPIFRMNADGSYLYFRTITREEAAAIGITDGIVNGEQEDNLIEAAIIHPTFNEIDIDSFSAGIPKAIASKILDMSCLTSAETLSNKFNEIKSSKTIYHTISSIICTAFPAIVPDELDSLNIIRLLELLMMAEEALLIQSVVSTGKFDEIDFADDQEEGPMTDEQKDAAMRRALQQNAAGVPSGWVDKTNAPPYANHEGSGPAI